MITSFVIILSLSNALTGCSVRSPMARVVGGLEAPFHRFEPNNVEFKKFKNIFVQYATKDGERDKQLRHFFDAYDRVRNEYVYALLYFLQKLLNDLIKIDHHYLRNISIFHEQY